LIVVVSYFVLKKIVLRQPPISNSIKCNIDGASNGNLGLSSCGGIFRNNEVAFIGAFAYNLGISNFAVV